MVDRQLATSEAYLLELAIRRDKAAFTALYERHVERVYKYVYYWVPSQAEAEDVTQEVFVRAWKAIDRYKVTETPFIAWLTTIARNLIASHYRGKKRLVPLEEAESKISTDDGPETLAELNFTRGYVRDAVMKLKGEKQNVILMRFINNMSYAEIAQALHKTEGAVRVIQFRALRELRAIVQKREDE